MSKVVPISGFPELLPGERQVERAVIGELSRVFELHGFANIETRVAEPLERLAKGGEIDKEIYVLRRLQADADDPSDTGLGLHFDLTVPFARYVLENAGRLQFPFRRYQIQKAWRGERPQEGRYREFTQADIDIVGQGELPFHHDVEVARVLAEALAALPLPPMRLQVNNRKLIEGFYRGLGLADPAAVMRVVDKLDKLSPEQVHGSLVADAGCAPGQADACLRLAGIRAADGSFVEAVRALGVRDELLHVGLEELAAVLEGCRPAVGARLSVEADLRIARGLDYYTGTVFELYLVGYESLKSIGGGGRYDTLATQGTTTYPGVGISFGISRTLVPLLARGVLRASRPVPSAVLVAVADEDSRDRSDEVAQRLRARGIPTEVAPSAQRYGRQIRSAERRGIPFVWFPGEPGGAGSAGRPAAPGGAGPAGHEVKDIRTGVQVPADPDGWEPPVADRYPTIATEESPQ